MRKNRIVSGFAVLALAAGLLCMSGLAGSEAFARTVKQAYNVLYSFEGGTTDGQYPCADLIISGTTLYGMAEYGGANSGGVIFKYDMTGSGCKVLHTFGGDGGHGERGGGERWDKASGQSHPLAKPYLRDDL